MGRKRPNVSSGNGKKLTTQGPDSQENTNFLKNVLKWNLVLRHIPTTLLICFKTYFWDLVNHNQNPSTKN